MNIGIILAGGSGQRMGNMELPKQFTDIYGKPIIVHTLEAFDLHLEIDEIVIVCKKEYIEDMKILVRKFDLQKVKQVIEGGVTRQESVYNGLKAIENKVSKEDVVLIHDAVRPLISGRIISDNIKGALEYGSVDTVIPTTDTIIKSVEGIYLDEVPVRRELYLGQTPQSFKYEVIKKSHDYCLENGILDATDDCQLVKKNGYKVALVNGDKLNFKITTQEDLMLLKALVKMSKLERI